MEKYSYSKIKCFYSCPLCFYKKYFERPELEDPSLCISHGTSEFGSFVHEILEEYEKGNLAIYDMLPYYKKHYNEKITSDFTLRLSDKFTKDFSKQYYFDGKNYLENFCGFNDFEVLEAEYNFEEVINNSFIFVGKIDLIARDEDGGLIIIDHKSKSKFKSKAERKEYAMQLYLYAYAAYKKYGEYPTKLMFNMFRKDTWEVFDFSLDEMNEAIEWLINAVNEIESCFEFPPLTGSFYCWNFCCYREANFEECNRDGG